MKCPKCKFITSDGKTACPKCGLNLGFARSSSKSSISKNKEKRDDPSFMSILVGKKKKPAKRKNTTGTIALDRIKKHLDLSNSSLQSVVNRREAPKESDLEDFENFINNAALVEPEEKILKEEPATEKTAEAPKEEPSSINLGDQVEAIDFPEEAEEPLSLGEDKSENEVIQEQVKSKVEEMEDPLPLDLDFSKDETIKEQETPSSQHISPDLSLKEVPAEAALPNLEENLKPLPQPTKESSNKTALMNADELKAQLSKLEGEDLETSPTPSAAEENLLDSNLVFGDDFTQNEDVINEPQAKNINSTQQFYKEDLQDIKDLKLDKKLDDSLSRTPVVTPEVLEFDNNLDWESKLDSLLGDEELNVESVQTEQKAIISKEEDNDSFLLDDDMEVSIEFEVEDENGEEVFEEKEKEATKQLETEIPKTLEAVIPEPEAIAAVETITENPEDQINSDLKASQPTPTPIEELEKLLDSEIASLVSLGNSFASSGNLGQESSESKVVVENSSSPEERKNKLITANDVKFSDIEIELTQLSLLSEQIGASLSKDISQYKESLATMSNLEQNLTDELLNLETILSVPENMHRLVHSIKKEIELVQPEHSVELMIELEKFEEEPLVSLEAAEINSIKKKILRQRIQRF